jgi:hypothetical protein
MKPDEINEALLHAMTRIEGRMTMPHAEFQQACQVEAGYLQQKINPDCAMIRLLREAVRCSRECVELANVSPTETAKRLREERDHYRELSMKVRPEWIEIKPGCDMPRRSAWFALWDGSNCLIGYGEHDQFDKRFTHWMPIVPLMPIVPPTQPDPFIQWWESANYTQDPRAAWNAALASQKDKP